MKTRKKLKLLSAAVCTTLITSMAPLFAQAQRSEPAVTTPASCEAPLPDVVTTVKIPKSNDFYAAASADGCWIFVTAHLGQTENRLMLFSKSNGMVKLQREIPFTDPSDTLNWFRITPDQKWLIVASSRKFLVLDVAKIITGQPDVLMGRMSDPHFSGLAGSAFSSDGKYLFVIQPNTSWLTVIDLEKARASGFNGSSGVEGAPVAATAGGLALSPDDKLFYVHAAQDEENSPLPLTCKNIQRPSDPPDHPVDSLIVLGMKPGSPPMLSKVASVPSSCGSGWLTLSLDGNTLFASSREENAVFVYDTRPSKNGNPPVLITKVPVGAYPSHSELISDGHLLAVSNSNRLKTTATTTDTLTIIDTRKIASGGEPVLGTISVGADPRYIWSSDDGKLLFVDSIRSATLQIIDTTRLESALNKK
jgi:DNA-binding beta-propeller fold protein YncE